MTSDINAQQDFTGTTTNGNESKDERMNQALINQTPGYLAYWGSKDANYRMIQFLTGQWAMLKALELEQRGYEVCKTLDIENYDPQIFFNQMSQNGWTWVPIGLTTDQNKSVPLAPMVPPMPNGNQKVYNPFVVPPELEGKVIMVGVPKQGSSFGESNPFDYTVTAIQVNETSYPKNMEPDLFVGGPGSRIAGDIYFSRVIPQENDTYLENAVYGFKDGMFVKEVRNSNVLWHKIDENDSAFGMDVG